MWQSHHLSVLSVTFEVGASQLAAACGGAVLEYQLQAWTGGILSTFKLVYSRTEHDVARSRARSTRTSILCVAVLELVSKDMGLDHLGKGKGSD